MSQYYFQKNQLIIHSKKAPFFVLSILWVILFIFYLSTFIGLIIGILINQQLHIGYFILILGFLVSGFYFMRLYLWNKMGKEIIEFNKKDITYIADYKWFKDGKMTIQNTNIQYYAQAVGYEDDYTSVLVISNEKSQIVSVVRMPNDTVKRLIEDIQQAEGKMV